MGIPTAIEIALIVMTLIAAATDIFVRRIPNWITVPGALLGFSLQSFYGGWHGALLSLAGAAIGFGVFLVLHLAGGMGAGDVKLAGAVGAMVGAQAFVVVFIATGLIGGIVAIIFSLSRGRLREMLSKTAFLFRNFAMFQWNEVKQSSSLSTPDALRLPYGAVIAAGAMTFLAIYH